MDPTVWVCIYDSSQGRAFLHCKSILGLNISGFWHSSVTVFNSTYSYPGQFSVQSSEAQIPTERMMLGRTEKSREEFEEFLEKAKRKFRDGYHVIYNNCNGFSQECVQFLLRVSLPRYLLTFQYEFLKAPLTPDQKSYFLRFLESPNLPYPDVFPTPDSHKIVTFSQLQAVQTSPFAVLVFWTKADRSYEYLNDLHSVGTSCKRAEFFWVNADAFPHLAPVQVPLIQISAFVRAI